MDNNQREPVDLSLSFAVQTPLEKILGIECAEETYDMLTFREQLILDLLIVGWTQAQIALYFEVKGPSIASSVRRMRFKLANSKLKLILDSRQLRREGRQ